LGAAHEQSDGQADRERHGQRQQQREHRLVEQLSAGVAE
jgi:hypothetical protein